MDHPCRASSRYKIVRPACQSPAIPPAKRPAPPGPEGLDPRIVKAISHPLRFRVLARLNAGVASPVEIARELDVPVGRVSHHVRTLARIGAIELVSTRPRRGAVEHFYRAAVPAWFSDSDWAGLPRSAREAISGQNVEAVMAHVAAAAQGLGDPRAHLSFVPLELDERGMEEMAALLLETLERAYEVEKRAAERGGEVGTELVMLHFERAG